MTLMRTFSPRSLPSLLTILSGLVCVAGPVAWPAAAAAPSAGESSEYLVAPSIPYGSRIQRVMRLLATATPQHKHRVRILFYGQSITGGWTDIVLKDHASHGRRSRWQPQ